MSSIDGWLRPRAPRKMFVKDICCVVAGLRASSSLPAAMMLKTVKLLGRFEAAAVDPQRRNEQFGREIGGEGIGDARVQPPTSRQNGSTPESAMALPFLPPAQSGCADFHEHSN
jgi:hypothetical protein